MLQNLSNLQLADGDLHSPEQQLSMGLGILEPRAEGKSTNVPGTAVLYYDSEVSGPRPSTKGIVVVPQPSVSPRDPLVSVRVNDGLHVDTNIFHQNWPL